MPPAASSTSGTNGFFVGAPLTKITGVAAMVLFATAKSGSFHLESLAFDGLRVRDHGEIYRYVSSVVTFQSTSQLLPCGMLLVYALRRLEREMSSRKTTVLVVWVNLFSMACQAFAVPYLLYHDYNLRYCGPYALMGALFYYFHRYTPRIVPKYVSILGFHLSDKMWQYIWYAQVAFGSAGAPGAGVFGTGILAAWIFDKFLPKVDVPDGLASLVGGIVGRISDPPPRTIMPGRGVPRQRVATAAAAAAVAPPRNVPPSEEAIEQLTNMGFPRARVVEALQATNNDVQRAADRLLMQS